ncbi:MAG: sulfatase [Planctomycetaceae bacterium]|nr:sulfatase [Planctomycetaceae bacterium]
MNPTVNNTPDITRRHFFGRAQAGIGSLALASLLNEDLAATRADNPLPVNLPHFAPRAKRVICLFMLGGPSQIELLDWKSELVARDGQPVPEDLIAGQRFAFITGTPSLAGSRYKFSQHGQCGAEVSELLPHLAGVVDEVAIVRSMHSDAFNHEPATTFFNTGAMIPGRPSMGSWLTYGLGSETSNLPGFVVLASGISTGPPAGLQHWSSGFLPTVYQGVRFRSQGEAVLFVSNPPGIDRNTRRRALDALRDLNQMELDAVGDPEIATRIAAFETAFQMQISVPNLTDLSTEPQSMLEMYGAQPGVSSFASNCLLACRLARRGVRFIQLYHRHWDHHGFNDKDQNILHGLPARCREIDQPCAALLRDLKQRGLLDETLVIWGGEFGRTPMIQNEVSATRLGRDHHPRAFSIWLAGGGIKPGITVGATDDLGYNVVEDPIHVHDLHATMLHLLGIDHTRLTYRFQGLDQRLTNVGGRIVDKLLA